MDQSTRAKRAGRERVNVGSGKVQYLLHSQVQQRLFSLCSMDGGMPACVMDGFFNIHYLPSPLRTRSSSKSCCHGPNRGMCRPGSTACPSKFSLLAYYLSFNCFMTLASLAFDDDPLESLLGAPWLADGRLRPGGTKPFSCLLSEASLLTMNSAAALVAVIRTAANALITQAAVSNISLTTQLFPTRSVLWIQVVGLTVFVLCE